ncbi:MAG: hypothetical protein U0W24_01680 [Bacteroidales bacterium]
MQVKKSISRRKFFKTSAIASTAVIGGISLASSCTGNQVKEKTGQLPVFMSEKYNPSDGIAGLLYSQIGYESGFPVRIIARLPKKDLMSENSVCKLLPVNNEKKLHTTFTYWGEIWGSHWWVADFGNKLPDGEWNIEVTDGAEKLFEAEGLKVGKSILWDKTIELCAADMLERRVHFTKVGAGWQDAGTLWVESPAQSAMVISLCELLEKKAEAFNETFKKRIYKQITVGCDYFVMLQKKATELGFSPGAQSHDLHGHEKDVLPNDAMKTVVALAKAIRLLPDEFSEKISKYKETALLTFKWLTESAKPLGDKGLSRFQRGIAENEIIPANEWQTRDLITLCWASLELFKCGHEKGKDFGFQFASEIMARQISHEKAENSFYGHFIEYPSMSHSEKSWIHGIVNNEFGADIGGIYPNYLMPLIDMIKLWPDHADAAKWKETLENFVVGYLIPACRKNPFYLVPQGIFGNEGPIWFCGTFHGTNAIYGYTAALALELSKLLNEPKLADIAYGNLQWLAGLNGGITRDNLNQGCVIFSTDVPEGAALPASMMCGVGNRWAGTWFQTRGVICNGFSTGKQFVYDTAPIQKNDGPFSLTDEDWIPHTAAWLTGLVRLKV